MLVIAALAALQLCSHYQLSHLMADGHVVTSWQRRSLAAAPSDPLSHLQNGDW